MKLQISEDLSLPIDTVTQTVAVIAKRRAGKSYLMRRMAEQLFKCGQQIVIVDPKGDQWGIRSAADGKSPGLPIVILGGERGDAPLEVSGGEVVAKLVVEERVSALIDLSLFRKGDVARFMTDFLENLYRLKAREIYRTPMMLVIDEADAIAPQKPMDGEQRMLGAAEDIVRRGGQRGIGCMLVSQRSAVLNKNVLTQAQILVALRTIAPQDLAAMDAWINVHGEMDQRKTMMESLPSLPIGDAWFWAPGWPTTEGIFKRVHVLPIETFDSGSTPKPGVKPVEPKRVADIDLDALKRQMADTIEKAKNDDPRELRKKIADLTKQIAAKPTSQVATKEVEKEVRVEVPVLKNGQLERTEKLIERLELIGARTIEQAKSLKEMIAPAFAPKATPIRLPPSPRVIGSDRRQEARIVQAKRPDFVGEQKLGKCERAILQVLSQFLDGCNSGKLTLLTGYRWSGTFSNALGNLRTQGMIVGGNSETMRITDEGIAQGPFEPLPQGQALLDFWLTHRSFGKCERQILGALIGAYPNGLTKEELCEKTGYQWSGTFSNALGNLRTADVVTGRNAETMCAATVLFGEG